MGLRCLGNELRSDRAESVEQLGQEDFDGDSDIAISDVLKMAINFAPLGFNTIPASSSDHTVLSATYPLGLANSNATISGGGQSGLELPEGCVRRRDRWKTRDGPATAFESGRPLIFPDLDCKVSTRPRWVTRGVKRNQGGQLRFASSQCKPAMRR